MSNTRQSAADVSQVQTLGQTHAQAQALQRIQTVVDLNDFCDTALERSGQSLASDFAELKETLGGHLNTVDWTVIGSRQRVMGAEYDKTSQAYHRFLHVRAQTTVGLTCVRCLNVMQTTLSVDSLLQVFQTEAAADAAAMSEQPDTTPDPIVTSRQFDVLAQIQEELLLNLPDNPMHLQTDIACVSPLGERTIKLSPFAVLADFKSKTHT